MHPRTIATLEQLENADWFSAVGVNDTDEAAIVLSSWQEAIEHCSSIEWENVNLEGANSYRERLVERSPERFQKWNDIAREVRPVTDALVRRKIKLVVQQNNLPKVFENCVQWDIAHVCMEAEFADVYPPGYYGSQGYWYTVGHFPCGWKGNFPEGILIVY
jgi:hypothetical protein